MRAVRDGGGGAGNRAESERGAGTDYDLEMNIQITYTWTFEEYRWLHRSHAEALMRVPLVQQNSLFASPQAERRFLLVTVGALTLFAWVGMAWMFGHSIWVVLFGSLLLIPWVWIYWGASRSYGVRDAWMNNGDFREPVACQITDEHVMCSVGGMQLTLNWAGFSYVFEDETFLIFFRGTQMAMAIPKRAFSAADLEAVRERCEPLMGPPRTRAFPVVR